MTLCESAPGASKEYMPRLYSDQQNNLITRFGKFFKLVIPLTSNPLVSKKYVFSSS